MSMPSSTARFGAPGQPPQSKRTSWPIAASRPKISCKWISAPPACGLSRSCQLTTRIFTIARPWEASPLRSELRDREALHPTHAAGKRIEHAVDELRALDRSIPLGEMNRFLNHDARRLLALLQFRGGQSQHATIDHAQPLESPIGRDLRQFAIERGAVLHERAHETTGELALVRRQGEVVPDLRRHSFEGLARTKIPRIQRLQHARARARFNSRPRHPGGR